MENASMLKFHADDIILKEGGTYEEMIEDSSVDEEFLKRNILLKGQQRLRANFRSGYWEVICLHTKPLDVVPRDMRVCEK